MSDYDTSLDRAAKTMIALIALALVALGVVLGRCSAHYTVKVDVQKVEAR
jgi:hypothetical protein